MSASVPSASNLPPNTTWLPASSAVTDHMNGPLWYSGPGITIVPFGVSISSGFASGSISAGAVLRISFGRPVLPPDVIPFHGSDTVSSRCSAAPGGAGSGVQPRGRQAEPGWSAGSTPTITAGDASSMMPSSSRFGSRDDTGVGVAPTFHAAIIAARNSTQLGSARTTMSP